MLNEIIIKLAQKFSCEMTEFSVSVSDGRMIPDVLRALQDRMINRFKRGGQYLYERVKV